MFSGFLIKPCILNPLQDFADLQECLSGNQWPLFQALTEGWDKLIEWVFPQLLLSGQLAMLPCVIVGTYSCSTCDFTVAGAPTVSVATLEFIA